VKYPHDVEVKIYFWEGCIANSDLQSNVKQGCHAAGGLLVSVVKIEEIPSVR